ncbi:NAD(P)-binding domain-containing protein [Microtetraspora malaysiensis]|uniref:NAD(P)-binding domain-containing protein n=1 Tax=Microtetraspora malaysiensis TaxID=161358 RepID=UPI003D904DAC
MIAFLGLGRMGALMARRLVDAGHQVTVWNRTHKEISGAAVAATPAEAVAGADLVITMLADPDAVDAVVRAALPGLRPDAVVVEMSTIGPDAVARLRGTLPSGAGLVDAPVLGSVEPAKAGKLVVLAGGSPEDLARCRDVLAVFGTVREVGGPGSGAALKLAVMSALVSAQVMLAENLAYAERMGIAPATFLDVLAGTPLGAFADRLAAAATDRGPAETRYALGLAAKDLRLATGGVGAGQTVAAAARDLLAAAEAAGLGAQDLTAVVRWAAAADAPGDAAIGEGARGGKAAVRINPSTVAPTNGRYSHAVRFGDLLFVSGQVAADEHGHVLGEDDMARQTEHIFENLRLILADQGSSFDDVIHVKSFVTDMGRLADYGNVRARYLTGKPPSSTTVEVSRLFLPGALLEVEVIAAIP